MDRRQLWQPSRSAMVIWMALFFPGFVLLVGAYVLDLPTVDAIGKYMESASGIVILVDLARRMNSSRRR